MESKRHSKFTPLVITASIAVGILFGTFFANHFSGNRLNIVNSSSNKLNDLIQIINDRYVDTVNFQDLVEHAVPKILEELDPHSTYTNPKDVEIEMQNLKGSFSGIGVIFTIIDDTARVLHVIEGGPSEEVGLKPGDRIIKVDNDTFTGKKLTNDYAMKRLKGPKDSKVTVTIQRKKNSQPINYNIIRGDIPVKSLDCAYMYDDKTGYIRINTFGDTTYPELLAALARLQHEGFQRLIIDLRGNRGGYLAPAVQMANEFLSKDQLIVYTEGRKSPKVEYNSDGRGSYQDIPLIVLVDEGSASASEIFTAAMQDNDRATIIGRRTFGKGLVQEPIQFSDKSLLRLTIARYYSPSGRCLQKPYEKGHDQDYQLDLLTRAKNGEYYSKDSIHQSGKQYKTKLGRTVYGGGGVVPDIFIPTDTIGITSYFQEALYNSHIAKFTYRYVDNNRDKLGSIGNWKDVNKFLNIERLPEKFADFAAKDGLKKRPLMLQKSHALFQDFINAFIIDDFYGQAEKIMYNNLNDPCVLKAIDIFEEGKAFPSRETANSTTSTHP